jgi:hypothetical protein
LELDSTCFSEQNQSGRVVEAQRAPNEEEHSIGNGIDLEPAVEVSTTGCDGDQSETRDAPEFSPTSDWQEVPPGTVLPSGLQVEMDVTTGRQRARWAPLTCIDCGAEFSRPKHRGRPPRKCPDCRLPKIETRIVFE